MATRPPEPTVDRGCGTVDAGADPGAAICVGFDRDGLAEALAVGTLGGRVRMAVAAYRPRFAWVSEFCCLLGMPTLDPFELIMSEWAGDSGGLRGVEFAWWPDCEKVPRAIERLAAAGSFEMVVIGLSAADRRRKLAASRAASRASEFAQVSVVGDGWVEDGLAG